MGLFLEALDREIAELHAKRRTGALHRRAREPLGAAAGTYRGRRAAHRRQSRARAADRRQLRRPMGYYSGRSELARECSSGAMRPEDDHREPLWRGAGARRAARRGPPDPHRRRAAHQQLPAVEPRLRGAVLHRPACGRTSPWRTSSRRSATLPRASGASGGARRRSAARARPDDRGAAQARDHLRRARGHAARDPAVAAAVGHGAGADRDSPGRRLGMVGVPASVEPGAPPAVRAAGRAAAAARVAGVRRPGRARPDPRGRGAVVDARRSCGSRWRRAG